MASFVHANIDFPPIRGTFQSNEAKTLKWMEEVQHPWLISLKEQKRENDIFGKLIVVWDAGTVTVKITPEWNEKQDTKFRKVEADHWIIPEIKTEEMHIPLQHFFIISKDEYYTESISNFEKNGKKVPLREYFTRIKTRDEPDGMSN